ncbi:MAG: polyphosphate kinase 1, partial [Bacteroidota bacterium]
MSRNLDFRSEVVVPVFDKGIQKELKDILEIQWRDNVKARMINEKQDNIYRTSESKTKVRAQDEIYKYLRKEKVALQTEIKIPDEIRLN